MQIKSIMSILIIFSLGLFIGMIDFGSSEVQFGSDIIGEFILYERLMEQEELDGYLNTGLIIQYDVDIEGGTTQFWYDIENSLGLTTREIEEYLRGKEDLRELKKLNLQPDLLNQDPYDCRRSDEDKTRIFGIYTLDNGDDFALFNDTYCWRLLNE